MCCKFMSAGSHAHLAASSPSFHREKPSAYPDANPLSPITPLKRYSTTTRSSNSPQSLPRLTYVPDTLSGISIYAVHSSILKYSNFANWKTTPWARASSELPASPNFRHINMNSSHKQLPVWAKACVKTAYAHLDTDKPTHRCCTYSEQP